MATSIGLGSLPAAGEPHEAGLSNPQVTAVRKALRLLAAFRGAAPELGLSELARRADMPKSTAFRLLADLESAGFVERNGSMYRLGLSLFELGSRVSFNRPNGLREVAMHDLSQLYVTTGLTVDLAVLSGTEIVIIERFQNARRPRTRRVPGFRVPASCTALGKAILAFSQPEDVRTTVEAGLPRLTAHSITEPGRFLAELKRVREAGVAHEREESALGIFSVSAPVMANGWAIASVALSGATTGVNWQFAEAQVRTAAESIARLHQMAWDVG